MKVHARPKELDDLYRLAESEGCDLSISNRQHIVVTLPDGARFYGPKTASDRRSVLNVRAQLRAYGLTLRSKKRGTK